MHTAQLFVLCIVNKSQVLYLIHLLSRRVQVEWLRRPQVYAADADLASVQSLILGIDVLRANMQLTVEAIIRWVLVDAFLLEDICVR